MKNDPGAKEDPAKYAIDTFAFYLCYQCKSPYFGGKKVTFSYPLPLCVLGHRERMELGLNWRGVLCRSAVGCWEKEAVMEIGHHQRSIPRS